MKDRPTDVDAYLAAVPEDARRALQSLRLTIRDVAPQAEESISYGVPTFKYRGRPLAYFGAAKHHCALYGFDITAHKDELAAYDTAKGTIRFSPDKPLPQSLVQTLVRERMDAIDAALAKPRRQRAG